MRNRSRFVIPNATGAGRWAVERLSRIEAGWCIAGLLVVLFAACLTRASLAFGYETDVVDMPVLMLAAGLVAVGVIFLTAMAWLLRDAAKLDKPVVARLMWTVFATGLAARLVLMSSAPILESDYQRYLWDGAVVAEGLNPYLKSPSAIATHITEGPLQSLKEQAGPVFSRINHKDLTTIYPPLTEAAFALANLVSPFNLFAWRSVLLIADLATFALLLSALDVLGRPRLWSALYWWNPVLLKEIYNSAHFEVLIFPFLLAALLLAHRRRPISASVMLGLAAGFKFWPALLLPLILRPGLHNRRTSFAAAAVFAVLMSLWLAPMVLAGLGENAGLSAYALSWNKNGPVFAIISGAAAHIGWAFGMAGDGLNTGIANLVARGIVAAMVVFVAFAAAYRPVREFDDMVLRALVIVAALVVCSPAVYPWYTLWLLPLLVLRPEPSLLMLSATIPIYYTYFYFAARETTEVFHTYVMWLIWLPVFALFVWRRGESRLSKIALGAGG